MATDDTHDLLTRGDFGERGPASSETSGFIRGLYRARAILWSTSGSLGLLVRPFRDSVTLEIDQEVERVTASGKIP